MSTNVSPHITPSYLPITGTDVSSRHRHRRRGKAGRPSDHRTRQTSIQTKIILPHPDPFPWIRTRRSPYNFLLGGRGSTGEGRERDSQAGRIGGKSTGGGRVRETGETEERGREGEGGLGEDGDSGREGLSGMIWEGWRGGM